MELPTEGSQTYAPSTRWCKDRKGEHIQLLQQMHAQGFLRARIDGEVYELDEPPKLDLRKKHTIEVVIDRFKVKPDIEQRLAESFEMALKLADDIAEIAFIDDPKAESVVFSARFACPKCGYSVTEVRASPVLIQQPNWCLFEL